MDDSARTSRYGMSRSLLSILGVLELFFSFPNLVRHWLVQNKIR
jgi:hypothetical protein